MVINIIGSDVDGWVIHYGLDNHASNFPTKCGIGILTIGLFFLCYTNAVGIREVGAS